MKLNYVKVTQANWGDFLYVGQTVSREGRKEVMLAVFLLVYVGCVKPLKKIHSLAINRNSSDPRLHN